MIRSDAMSRALEERRKRMSPMITDDGFEPVAIVIGEAPSCHLWQGDMIGPEPQANHRGAVVKPRLLAVARAYRPAPPGPLPAHGSLR